MSDGIRANNEPMTPSDPITSTSEEKFREAVEHWRSETPDEVTIVELIDGVEWRYTADRTLTIKVPHTPIGDNLHEYLREVGEPLE